MTTTQTTASGSTTASSWRTPTPPTHAPYDPLDPVSSLTTSQQNASIDAILASTLPNIRKTLLSKNEAVFRSGLENLLKLGNSNFISSAVAASLFSEFQRDIQSVGWTKMSGEVVDRRRAILVGVLEGMIGGRLVERVGQSAAAGEIAAAGEMEH